MLHNTDILYVHSTSDCARTVPEQTLRKTQPSIASSPQARDCAHKRIRPSSGQMWLAVHVSNRAREISFPNPCGEILLTNRPSLDRPTTTVQYITVRVSDRTLFHYERSSRSPVHLAPHHSCCLHFNPHVPPPCTSALLSRERNTVTHLQGEDHAPLSTVRGL